MPKIVNNPKSCNAHSIKVRPEDPTKHLRMNFAGCRDHDTLEAAKFETRSLTPSRSLEGLDNSHTDTASRLREISRCSNIDDISVKNKDSSRSKDQNKTATRNHAFRATTCMNSVHTLHPVSEASPQTPGGVQLSFDAWHGKGPWSQHQQEQCHLQRLVIDLWDAIRSRALARLANLWCVGALADL